MNWSDTSTRQPGLERDSVTANRVLVLDGGSGSELRRRGMALANREVALAASLSCCKLAAFPRRLRQS